MGVQNSQQNNSFPFLLGGVAFIRDSQTILTDGSRTVPLYQYTIMSQIASTGKWTPWLNANLGATDGKQYPMGIYMGDDITAAALVAGDVTGVNILYAGHGCELDASQLVYDKGSTGAGTPNTLASIPTVPTNLAMQADQILSMKGLITITTVAADNYEN